MAWGVFPTDQVQSFTTLWAASSYPTWLGRIPKRAYATVKEIIVSIFIKKKENEKKLNGRWLACVVARRTALVGFFMFQKMGSELQENGEGHFRWPD